MYSNVFFGTTAEKLNCYGNKLEADILEKDQQLVIDDLDLHSEEINIIQESDHETRKLKIRERIKAKLDDSSRKLILRAKKMRFDLKAKWLYREQLKEKWQRKKQQHIAIFLSRGVTSTSSDTKSI